MKEIQAFPGSEEYQARIDELHNELRNYTSNPHSLQTDEAPEEWEQEIAHQAKRLTALITGLQI